MKKLSNLLKWLDTNILYILVGLFVLLIPLYPKLPLRMVNYTYIAVRLEDLYMAVLLSVFFIQLVRKKVELNRKFFVLFLLYWGAVFLSTLNGIFLTKDIVISNLGFLHAIRRVEYMAIFLIVLSIVKTKKHFYQLLSFFFVSLLLVNIYGMGQKFLGWPAVQTMNPEYAKGYFLFLTPEARISSTFAGHYDLAAYLVFLIPIVLGYYFSKGRFYYFFLACFSILSLIFTASRISYGAYLISTLPFLIFLKKPKHFLIILLLTIALTFTSKNLTSRFSRTFQVKQIFVNQNTGQVVVPQKITSKEVPAGTFYINLKTAPKPGSANQAALLNERLLEEIRTDARSTGKKLTPEEEQMLIASMTANLKPINTVVSDISFATRLQVEWPRAINAFLKNPLFGTGPSSITEATDNDYLRSIGEVG
ncbi:O-antigen ligase family protein, partial [Candidatus Roizmanbacteria bacterium]|nr:O-antigen ligase family protein [Candidatus Roizmanbacteria bacterium]